MRSWSFPAVCLCFLGLCLGATVSVSTLTLARQAERQGNLATRKPQHDHKATAHSGVHADTWTFSQGVNSRDAWREGMPMESLRRRALPHSAPPLGKHRKAMNTAPGIDSALKEVDKRQQRQRSPKGKMGVSVREENATWREEVGPMQMTAPDEHLPMERRHVVRAYAGVQSGDDLRISVGPELILKNESHEIPHAAGDERQPDSALGLGMQFQYDF